MVRKLLVGMGLALSPMVALGQTPFGTPPGVSPYAPAALGSIPQAGVLPNFFNRQYQPISPYLNLARGGNPAVNYYYGVRPAQIANGQLPGGAAFGAGPFASNQPAFIPALNQVPPGAMPVVEELPGQVPGFAPIGPASYGIGLTRFQGVYGGGPAATGRTPNAGLSPLQRRR